jgi:hypothetical protein
MVEVVGVDTTATVRLTVTHQVAVAVATARIRGMVVHTATPVAMAPPAILQAVAVAAQVVLVITTVRRVPPPLITRAVMAVLEHKARSLVRLYTVAPVVAVDQQLMLTHPATTIHTGVLDRMEIMVGVVVDTLMVLTETLVSLQKVAEVVVAVAGLRGLPVTVATAVAV